MPSIQFIVTDAGRAALVNAQHNGTNAVTIAQMGVSGTPIVATPATAALPGEVKRIATISGGAVAADTMHVVVRDESADIFTVRSFAFYLSDGTLFGAYGQAGVIAEKSAQAMLLFAVDAIFADIDAAMLTFGDANFLNPPATIDTAGVVKLATDADAIALNNAIKALTPRGMALAFTAANVLARLLTVDGSGSGLDADLLDGQDGSYYTNIIARLGYTPFNAASFTGAEILPRLLTVDGPGSGLDADLLDGRQAAEFALLTGAAFSGHVSVAGHLYATAPLPDDNCILGSNTSATGYGPYFRGGSSSRYVAQFVNYAGAGVMTLYDNRLELAISSLSRAGNTVWDAANDGAGSGLDADLLDGRHAAEFALLTGASFSGPISAANLISSSGGSAGFTFADRANGDNWVVYASGGIANFYVNGGNRLSISASGALASAGPITRGGNTVWDAANDGPGSGLDADLLDGRQASEFALLAGSPTFAGGITAPRFIGNNGDSESLRSTGTAPYITFYNAAQSVRYGYIQHSGTEFAIANDVAGSVTVSVAGATKLAVTSAGTNFTGSLTRASATVWDAANDGAGSGLDADLLDGRQATEFALLSGATFTGSVTLSQAQMPALGVLRSGVGAWYVGGTGVANSNGFGIRYNALSPYLSIDTDGTTGISASLNVGGALRQSGNQVWHVGNDGPGSGLDADLLDGRHAAEFALLTDATRAGSNANGYWEKRPNGVIEQWGQIAGPFSEGTALITFPIEFTDANSIVITPVPVNTAANDKYDITFHHVSATVNGGVVMVQYTAAATSINLINGINWRAIGR